MGSQGADRQPGAAAVGYPAAYAASVGMAVGAVDLNGRMASFSNRAGSTPLDYVTAPGVNIYSTLLANTFGYFSGTLMLVTKIVEGVQGCFCGPIPPSSKHHQHRVQLSDTVSH